VDDIILDPEAVAQSFDGWLKGFAGGWLA